MFPQERRQIAIRFPDVMIPDIPTWRPYYKAPPSEIPWVPPQISPDHRSLKLPVPRWLLGGEFVPHRIKLVHTAGDGTYLEYLMPAEQSESVIVRMGGKNEQISVDELRHILPDQKNDLVVPLEGNYKGKAMKIKEYGDDRCTLLVVGAKPIQKKNYIHPSCDTNNLACVFPPR